MNGLWDALRAALRVWVFATIGLFLPGLLGWINDVTKWARDEGITPFPDAHSLGFLFVAAITAAFPAAVAGIVRWIENASGKTFLPRAAGPQPVPPPDERGASGVAIAALIIVVALLLFLLL